MPHPDVLQNLIQDLGTRDPDEKSMQSVPSQIMEAVPGKNMMDKFDSADTHSKRFWLPAAAWARDCGIASEVSEEQVSFCVFHRRDNYQPDGHLSIHTTRPGFLNFSLSCSTDLRKVYISEVLDIFGCPEIPIQGTVKLQFLASSTIGLVDVLLVLSWPCSHLSTDSDLQAWLDLGLKLGTRLRMKMKANGLL